MAYQHAEILPALEARVLQQVFPVHGAAADLRCDLQAAGWEHLPLWARRCAPHTGRDLSQQVALRRERGGGTDGGRE